VKEQNIRYVANRISLDSRKVRMSNILNLVITACASD